MNIGTVAHRSGVPAKTIRYYESVGLIPQAERNSNGYRRYSEVDVQTLRFIHRARQLGFTVEDVAQLLELWGDKHRASADVKALAERHIAHVQDKIHELETIRQVLLDLVARCHGDDRPECPILDEFGKQEADR